MRQTPTRPSWPSRAIKQVTTASPRLLPGNLLIHEHTRINEPKTQTTAPATNMFSIRRTLPASVRAFSTTTPRPLARMQIIGRLADQPELTPTSTGREITKFAVGVSSGPRDEQGNRAVSWYRVASFAEGPGREVLLGMEKG